MYNMNVFLKRFLNNFFTLMITWGSNNYFVKASLSLVWFWSDFGLSLVWMFKNYKISLFSQILMKKVENLGSFFESKNYFITKNLNNNYFVKASVSFVWLLPEFGLIVVWVLSECSTNLDCYKLRLLQT